MWLRLKQNSCTTRLSFCRQTSLGGLRHISSPCCYFPRNQNTSNTDNSWRKSTSGNFSQPGLLKPSLSLWQKANLVYSISSRRKLVAWQSHMISNIVMTWQSWQRATALGALEILKNVNFGCVVWSAEEQICHAVPLLLIPLYPPAKQFLSVPTCPAATLDLLCAIYFFCNLKNPFQMRRGWITFLDLIIVFHSISGY